LKLEKVGDVEWSVEVIKGVPAYVWSTSPIGVTGYCDVFGQGEREISQIFRGWVEKTAPGSISVSVRSIWDNYETK
jgi:hypothetical protein